jgi:hypothetical protein
MSIAQGDVIGMHYIIGASHMRDIVRSDRPFTSSVLSGIDTSLSKSYTTRTVGSFPGAL